MRDRQTRWLAGACAALLCVLGWVSLSGAGGAGAIGGGSAGIGGGVGAGLEAGLRWAVESAALAQGTGAGGAAQPSPTRAVGNYVFVSGTVNGSPQEIVYVIDAVNREMVALRWDRNGSRVDILGFRDLFMDGDAAPGRRGR